MANIKKIYLLLLSVAIFIVAIVVEDNVMNNHPEVRLIKKFQETFLEQETKLDKYLEQVANNFQPDNSLGDFNSEFIHLQPEFYDQGLGFLILENNQLLFWSDDHFAFSPLIEPKIKTDSLLILPNSIYYAKRKQLGSIQIIGLIHIKDQYVFENKNLRNNFVKPFRLPHDYSVLKTANRISIPVVDKNQEEIFYIAPYGTMRCNSAQLYIPAILYFIGFLVLLLFIRRKMKEYKEIFVWKMLLLASVLFIIYWLHLTFNIPTLFKSYELFKPVSYASSDWIPSLGDFFLLTILIFFWVVNFIREFFISAKNNKVLIVLALIFTALVYLCSVALINDLITNSNISFKLSQISDFNVFSLVAYLSVALLMFSSFLINLKIIEAIWPSVSRKTFLKIGIPIFIVCGVLSIVFKHTFLYGISLFVIVSLLLFAIRKRQNPRFSLSFIILFVAVFSVFSVLIIYNKVEQHDLEIQKLLAVNLSSENDPVAEVFLVDIHNRMSTDSIIPSFFNEGYDELQGYLVRNYFSGYFSAFDIQITVCGDMDNVLIQPDSTWVPCFPFFEDMIETSGTKLPQCNFYHMNNMNGQKSYLGRLHYPVLSADKGISIFIELNSKAVSEGIGFPELLMDESLIKPDKYKNLSHAKYFKNDLVHRSGDYLYNYYFLSYDIPQSDKDFQLVSWDGYNHLVYNLGEDNYIIVSNKKLTAVEFFISFPYMFVFYVIMVLIMVFIGNTTYREQVVPYDLKFKIQASIISIVLISLVIVAVGTLYYNVQEYQKKHQSDLREKMRSISEEIANRMADKVEITPKLHSWLLHELHKLSNIFLTDINIYAVNGELLATSRPEIYDKGIISTQMNTVAYYELYNNYLVNYFQPEQIGNLSYLSAYEPIINSHGDYLGFLNLPYFTKEDTLNQEISTFIVAFINLYVFLFLTSVFAAVILANQITRPLSLIRDKLKGIQLGKKSEQINYSAEDEIGSLVKEYNKKVDELAESAELLAKTERELAWREMAKQIAHEIKNPLTPMKLHIQYLQRAKESGNIAGEQFEKVTKTLIEQIDTLSDIATEFSNFAKIPKARNEVFNLTDKLRLVVGLFEANFKNRVSLELNGLKQVPIYADREQLSSALINLIKNGIQAIPEDRSGKIVVELVQQNDKALISVLDNGTGINEDLREHLFEPNFTTKTSGMGLGLAIVKNIVDNMNGRIWYETEMKVGTIFYIEIPIYTKE